MSIPIHYPGFSGSLYAVKDFHALHPALDAGDGTSPDRQVSDMLESAHDRGLKVMMDLVVNHTAKDAPWVGAHPDWYARADDGTVLSRSPSIRPTPITRRSGVTWLNWTSLRARPVRVWWLNWLPLCGTSLVWGWMASVAMPPTRSRPMSGQT